MRALNKLTAIEVKRVSGRGRHGDGGGLWLNVTSSDSKSWIFRWTPKGGTPREMGIGSYPAVSLAEARKRATIGREHVAAGRDPKAERDRDTGKTFLQAGEAYLEAMASKWTNEKTKWQWQDAVHTRSRPLHKRPVAQVDTADVLRVLKPMWLATPETAYRTRGRIEAVLDYSKAQEWREGENPARWKGHLENLLPRRDRAAVRHQPAMPYRDIPDFMTRLRTVEALAARALEMLILTATRTSEVLNAKWIEVDFENEKWVIPASRMKMKQTHEVPLSPSCLSLLKRLYEVRNSEFIFPGQKADKPLSNMSMNMMLRRMKVEGVTVHGFRSSFRDWCGDETEYPRETAEAALAHKVGNSVELAYRRGTAFEKRRQLMNDWDKYCG